MPNFLTAFLQTFTYVALVLILLAAGMGVPIPEDIPLITSGYMCNRDHSPIGLVDLDGDGQAEARTRESVRKVPHLPIMIIAGMLGVLGGDSIIFFIGRRGIDSDNFVARHIRKVMHSKRREWAQKHFARHGGLTVFAGRFMPGLRSLVFAMAGMAKMSYLRFILIDGFAALISVPTFILLGWYFADRINRFIDAFRHGEHTVFAILGVLAAAGLTLWWLRRRRAKALAALPPNPYGP